jgi:hypothetical protein
MGGSILAAKQNRAIGNWQLANSNWQLALSIEHSASLGSGAAVRGHGKNIQCCTSGRVSPATGKTPDALPEITAALKGTSACSRALRLELQVQLRC